MTGKKWWIWLMVSLLAAGIIAFFFCTQVPTQIQNGGTLVRRLKGICYG